MEWLEPKGEILLVQRPDKYLQVSLTTDKGVYAPGDPVNYVVNVVDSRTGKAVTDREVIISLVATDESVFSKIEDRKQPASLGAAIYLENEVKKNNHELYYSNQYIDHWFQNASKADPVSSGYNLNLLLGVQGWRSNVFDLKRLYDIHSNTYQMSEDEKIAYSQLLATANYQS